MRPQCLDDYRQPLSMTIGQLTMQPRHPPACPETSAAPTVPGQALHVMREIQLIPFLRHGKTPCDLPQGPVDCQHLQAVEPHLNDGTLLLCFLTCQSRHNDPLHSPST